MKKNICAIFGIILGLIYMAMGAYLYSTIGSVGVEIISWFLILDGLFTIFLSAMVLVVDSVESELFDQED